jgi:hypothetical protein
MILSLFNNTFQLRESYCIESLNGNMLDMMCKMDRQLIKWYGEIEDTHENLSQ